MKVCYYINNGVRVNDEFFTPNIILYSSRVNVVVNIFDVINMQEKGVQKKMRIGGICPTAFLLVLMNLILFSNIHGSLSQTSFATQQEEGIRTLEIEVNLDNPVIGHGKKQIIHFQVTDQKSEKPISGAITSVTVSYADGKTVRHISVPTDESGRSSISWTIGRDAPNGVYLFVYSVYQTGYVSESFGGSFIVGAQNVASGCSSSSYSSSSVLNTPRPSTNIAHSQTSETCNVIVSPSTHIVEGGVFIPTGQRVKR